MKKSKFCALFTTIIFIVGLLTSQLSFTAFGAEPITGDTLTQYQEIIKEVAYTYLRQGTQIQYDQTAKPPRRNIISSPEDATSQRTVYLDCSSFVNNVYYETFGIHLIRSGASTWSIKTANMLNAARDYPTRRENVGYWPQEEYADLSAEEQQTFLDEIYASMQAGDVIVYEKAAGGGHTLVYVGDGKFVHCTGSTGTSSPNPPSKYYDKSGVTEYTQGAVLEQDAARLFKDTSAGNYLTKTARFCIIRPLARTDIAIAPTPKALNRLTVKGLDMEKTASVHPDNCVDIGDEITYTITLNNTSDTTLSNVELTDIVPAGTTFVSGDVTNTEGNLSWTGDIAAGETASVSYTVEVTSETSDMVITSANTQINGVTINTTKHTIAGYSAAQRALVASKAKEYAQNSTYFRDGASLIMSAYKEAIGVDVFGYTDNGTTISAYSTADELLTQVIDSANFTCHTETELSKMLVPHLFGGIDITYNSKAPLDGQRRSNYTVDQLALGDIILAEYSGGEAVYMYVGDSQFVSLDANKESNLVTTTEGYYLTTTEAGSTFYRTYSANILVPLIAYDRFAILRPSMKPDTSDVTVTEIEITTPPQKLVYDSGDKIDTTGMVVTATMSDGTTRIVEGYALSSETISFPNTSVELYFGPFSATLGGLTANLTSFDVSELATAPTKTDIQVEGIYVGIATTSASTTAATYRPLMLIKDENTNDTTAVSLSQSMYTLSGSGVSMVMRPNGVTKGDKLVLTVQVNTGDPNYDGNSGRRYLTLADSTITSFADFVESSGNSTAYDLSKAIIINTWDDMEKYYSDDTHPPFFSLVLFTGTTYLRANSSKWAYYIHKNPSCAAAGDAKPSGGARYVALRRYTLSTNVITNWVANGIFGATSIGTSNQGTAISKDFYAIYVGNATNQFYHTILDSSWITNNKCYIESVSDDNSYVNIIANAPGTYTMYFADYEDNKLNTCFAVDVTAEAAGRMTVPTPEDFDIDTGDKVFFWESRLNSITPLAKSYTFE